ncbi:DUF4390 domain-containing protein [Parvibium lacunae]|nr:DUF4390 domain-containing protein [Parvibium lacunae]
MALFHHDHYSLRQGLRHPRFWVCCAFCLWLLAGVSARAEVIELRDVRIEANLEQEAYVLQADAAFSLAPVVEEALTRGVPLYFSLELQMRRPRWYWFDEKTLQFEQTYRLAYSSLTRQYRLTISQAQTSNLQLRFNTLNEALNTIRRIRNVRLADRQQLSTGTNYQVQLRLRLDLNQLPKPFQVAALTAREWNLTSDAKAFSFVPNAADWAEAGSVGASSATGQTGSKP